MDTKVGIVDSAGLNPSGQQGFIIENGTGARIEFEILRPDIYVVPGDSVEILVRTPSGRTLAIAVAVTRNGVKV